MEQREAALTEKQRELIELQARKTTKDLLPQIEKLVSDAKWVSRANIIKNGISNVLRTLTEAAKQASEEILKAFQSDAPRFARRAAERRRWASKDRAHGT